MSQQNLILFWDLGMCGVWLPVLSISYELIGIAPGISCPSHLPPSLICEKYICDIGKVQFSCAVVSNSLQPHGLLHARPPCPSPTAGAYPNLCPLSVMSSNHLILCCPLLPPSIFPSIRVFSSKSALRIRWPKYWSCSFNISPFNEHSGLISFRI